MASGESLESLPSDQDVRGAHIAAALGKPIAAVEEDVTFGEPFREAVQMRLPPLLALLRRRKGHDFSRYKLSGFASSIQRCMARLGIASVTEYCTLVESSEAETQGLFQELLIGTTSFFRNPEHWESLSRAVERYAGEMPEGSILRAWIPACSTGEDAFTLAMIVHEAVARKGRRIGTRLFATDINGVAIDFARRATYSANIWENVSPERLEAFFRIGDGTYTVGSALRQTVLFGQQNILMDPPIISTDIIVCRNLLIYLDVETRARVLSLFQYALRPGALLFVGAEETADDEELFVSVDRRHRVYRRAPGVPAARAFVWPLLAAGEVKTLRGSSDAPGSVAVETGAAAASVNQIGSACLNAVRDVTSRLRTARTVAVPSVAPADQELRSAIEQLVSTNEQLETSKEEITALNAELCVSNAALDCQVESLTNARNDLSNFVRGAGLAAVIVSDDLRILRFTDAARSFLPLRPTDLGRPLSDLSHHLSYERFIDDVREAIETLHVREVATKMGSASVLVRMSPYQTADNRIDGLVIAFLNTDRLLDSLRATGIIASTASRG